MSASITELIMKCKMCIFAFLFGNNRMLRRHKNNNANIKNKYFSIRCTTAWSTSNSTRTKWKCVYGTKCVYGNSDALGA